MDETKNISAGTARKIIAAVILAGVAAFTALNCLQPIIPAIGSAFGLRPAAASTIVGAGMLGIACALFILTFFAERLPRKRGICFIAFSIMGSFVAIYNFIPFVLRAAPYNFSQSLIGLIFLVQIFGSLSSAMSGKLIYRFGTVKVIVIDLFIMLVKKRILCGWFDSALVL